MEELLLADSHAYFYLENPEILLKDSQIYFQPRGFAKKVDKTCARIRKMICSGLSTDEIIDQSVELITAELRPSRFGYVCAVIASEFPKTFLGWVSTNALKEQVLDVLNACEPVFSLLKFNVRMAEQHSIYRTITNFVRHYLKRVPPAVAPESPGVESRNAAAAFVDTFTASDSVAPQPAVRREAVTKAESVVTPLPAVTAAPEGKTAATATPYRNVVYFNSELLEKSADTRHHEQALSRLSPAYQKPSERVITMASKQYPINKGINKSIVFKGLKAQYIGYMGLGLLIDLLFYAVLYLFKVNTYITLLLTLALGAITTLVVYHLNAHYGEHGLSKTLAKRKTPKIIRSFSRRLFR